MSAIAELKMLVELRSAGVLSDEEFSAAKRRLLGLGLSETPESPRDLSTIDHPTEASRSRASREVAPHTINATTRPDHVQESAPVWATPTGAASSDSVRHADAPHAQPPGQGPSGQAAWETVLASVREHSTNLFEAMHRWWGAKEPGAKAAWEAVLASVREHSMNFFEAMHRWWGAKEPRAKALALGASAVVFATIAFALGGSSSATQATRVSATESPSQTDLDAAMEEWAAGLMRDLGAANSFINQFVHRTNGVGIDRSRPAADQVRQVLIAGVTTSRPSCSLLQESQYGGNYFQVMMVASNGYSDLAYELIDFGLASWC